MSSEKPIIGNTEKSGASISLDGVYRYALWRVWDDTLPPALFIMLNPSTADGNADDPTIRRCIRFAQRENCGTLWVVNLFALRSTDPKKLYTHKDPFGPEKDATNRRLAGYTKEDGGKAICAWGTHGVYKDAGVFTTKFLSGILPLYCLGKTKDGHPKHPLYLPSDAPLTPYP